MPFTNMAKIGCMAADTPKEFVKRLMVAKCEEGSMKYQYLNLPKDHGVYVNDTESPLMNALDYKADRHVLQFGRCKAPGNPKNMIGEAVNKVFPLSIFAVADKIKDAMGCQGCKCSPKTLKVWQETNEGNCLDGANGILNTSHLLCCYGGKITITQIPQPDGEDSEENSGEDGNSKKTIEERMPQAMAEQLNSLNSEAEADSAGADEGASGGSGSGGGASGGSSSGGALGGETSGGGSFGGADLGEGSLGGAALAEGLLSGDVLAEGVLAGFSDSTDALISDMQDWYARVEDFEQNYGVSRATILSNYSNNQCMNIPGSALNEEGYICDAGELSNFRMGGASAALIGGACVSAFNAMHALGADEDLSDVIMAAELQQTIPGYMDQGPMAVGLMSTGKMLKSIGMETKMVRKKSKKISLDKDSVAIVGTSQKGGKVEYHTLKADKTGKICCMENKAREPKSLLKAERNETKMIMQVKRKTVKLEE